MTVPDLSFSEVNFLSNRREKPAEPERGRDKDKRRRDRKTADDDDDVSRFFTVTRAPLTERDVNSYHNNGWTFPLPPVRSPNRNFHRRSTTTTSTMVPADIPIRPFLGFGQRGPHPELSSGLSSNCRASVSPAKPHVRPSPLFPTSVFPWSTSPNRIQSSPRKKTVSDLFVSSPGKIHQERSRVSESPAPGQAKKREAIEYHEHAQSTVTNGDVAKSQKILEEQTCPGIAQMNASDYPDPRVDEQNVAVASAKLPSTIPQAEIMGTAGLAYTNDPIDKNLSPIDRPALEAQSHSLDTRTEGHNPPAQFAIALQRLLDQWKDKVTVPAEFAHSLQQSCAAPRVCTNDALPLSSLQPAPPAKEIPQMSTIGDKHQSVEDVTNKSVSQPTQSTLANVHLSPALPKFTRPASGISTGSVAKSQYSLTDSRILRNRAFVRSPFEDSTYSTCQGAGSIYEHQLPGYTLYSQQTHIRKQINEPIDFPHHQFGKHDMNHNFEQLDVPNHREQGTEYLAEYNPMRDSTFGSPMPRVLESNPTSANRDRISLPEWQQVIEFEVGRNSHYGDFEYAASPPRRLTQHFSSPRQLTGTVLERSSRKCKDNLGYLISPTRKHQLTSESLRKEGAYSGEVDEPPVGFWKPNRLY